MKCTAFHMNFECLKYFVCSLECVRIEHIRFQNLQFIHCNNKRECISPMPDFALSMLSEKIPRIEMSWKLTTQLVVHAGLFIKQIVGHHTIKELSKTGFKYCLIRFTEA
jgi:hypothetical protein